MPRGGNIVAMYVFDEDEEAVEMEEIEESMDGKGPVRGSNRREEAVLLLAMLRSGFAGEGVVMETYGVGPTEGALLLKMDEAGEEKPDVVLAEKLLLWWWFWW